MLSRQTTDTHHRFSSRSRQQGRKSYIFVARVGLILAAPLLLSAYPSNPPLMLTGAPGEGTCAGCHSSATAGTGANVTFPAMTYTPGGAAVSLTANVSGGNGGFELSTRISSSNAQAGSLTAGTNSAVNTSGSVQYLAQTAVGASWPFTWTPPATNVGNVILYIVGVTSGGQTITNNYTLTPAAPPAPTMSVSPGTLTFNSTGGASVPSQTFSVTSSGTAFSVTTSVSTTSGGSWLSASAGGTTPQTVTVSVNPAGMAAGSYSGTVSVASTGASNSPQKVSVTLNVTAPPQNTLSASPATLTFNYAGSGTLAAQSVMTSSTPASVTFNTAVSTSTGGNWLSATPASGTTPLNVSVLANPTGLAAGTYTGMVTITSSGATGSPQTVNVTLNVTAAPPALPTLSLSTSSMTFSSVGGATVTPTSVNLSSTGSALSFTTSVATTSGGNWLSASMMSGTTPASVSISANPAGMTSGTYKGTVTFAASGASNSPQTVNVALTVSPSTPPPTTSPGTLTYSFSVLDKQSSGSDYLMLDGQGTTSNGQITGGGNFTQFTVATDGSHQTVAMGIWTAKNVVSYSPSTYGSTYGGVLDITVELDPAGGTPMTGSMRIAGLSTDKGVSVSLDGGSSFVQSGIGAVWVGSGASGGYCLYPISTSGGGRPPRHDE